MNPRSDMPLIRHLCRAHGDEVAREWQRRPLVLLPEEGFGTHVLNSWLDLGPDSPPVLRNLPWPDFVLDVPPDALREFSAKSRLAFDARGDHIGPATRDAVTPLLDGMSREGRAWIRVRALSDAIGPRGSKSPWWHVRTAAGGQTDVLAPFLPLAADRVLIECFTEDGVASYAGRDAEGVFYVPDASVIDADRPKDAAGIAYACGNPEHAGKRAHGPLFCNYVLCPGISESGRHSPYCYRSHVRQSVIAGIACGAIAYLAACDEYPVEVREAIPPAEAARAARTARLKPWLRAGLPSVILIDPARVREYRDRPPGTDAHASPTPHQRRGHWRALRAERYREKRRLWIKPTWVGSAEWTAGDTVYRVLSKPEADAPNGTSR